VWEHNRSATALRDRSCVVRTRARHCPALPARKRPGVAAPHCRPSTRRSALSCQVVGTRIQPRFRRSPHRRHAHIGLACVRRTTHRVLWRRTRLQQRVLSPRQTQGGPGGARITTCEAAANGHDSSTRTTQPALAVRRRISGWARCCSVPAPIRAIRGWARPFRGTVASGRVGVHLIGSIADECARARPLCKNARVVA
jgi:hypothetical protein